MEWDLPKLFNRPAQVTDAPVGNARRRISAYIYGNILVLAALIPVTKSQETVGIAIVVGAALSTFLAHVFAESVGQIAASRPHPHPRRTRRGTPRRPPHPDVGRLPQRHPVHRADRLAGAQDRAVDRRIGHDRPDRARSVYVISRLRREKVTSGTALGGVRPRRGRGDHRGHQGISPTH